MERSHHPIECPHCGGTGFRVQFLQYMEQDYDAQEDAWEGDEVLGTLYVASVRCRGCKRNLNPRVLDRPTVQDLIQELRRRPMA